MLRKSSLQKKPIVSHGPLPNRHFVEKTAAIGNSLVFRENEVYH